MREKKPHKFDIVGHIVRSKKSNLFHEFDGIGCRTRTSFAEPGAPISLAVNG